MSTCAFNSALCRHRCFVVLVEQNLKVPMRLARRQYVLDHGNVAWQGTTDELHAQRDHVETLITLGASV